MLRYSLIIACAVLLAGGPAHRAFSMPARHADSISASSWLLLVEAALGGVHDSSAIFGVRPDATSGFDPSYDQPSPPHPPGAWVQASFPHSGEDWPTLLGDNFSVDIQQPDAPAWLLVVDSNLPSGAVTLSWDTTGLSALGSGYAILMKDSAAGLTVDMRRQAAYVFAYTGSRRLSILVVTPDDVTTIAIAPKWNLLSVPRFVQDSAVTTLFPSTVSPAYAYEGLYQAHAALSNGVGYWMKFAEAGEAALTGSAISSLTIALRPGWNLVGTIERPVPAPTGGVIASAFFGYAGRYVASDTLYPGQGYWVKASDTGSVTLGGGAAIGGTPGAERPGTALTVSDDDGVRASLYLAATLPARPGVWDLPPLPPAGAFDVRFVSGRSVEAVDPAASGTGRIAVRSRHDTLRLSSEGPMEGSLDGLRWQRLPMTIPGSGEILIRPAAAPIPTPRADLGHCFLNPSDLAKGIPSRLVEAGRETEGLISETSNFHSRPLTTHTGAHP